MNNLAHAKAKSALAGLLRSQKKLENINQKSLSPAVAQTLSLASVRLDQAIDGVRQALHIEREEE